MSKLKLAIVSILLLVLFVEVSGQNFPVRVTPIITPPYSPFLTDYTDPGSDKLMLQVMLNDITVSSYRCKFRLAIEGVNISITTNPNYLPAPITLQGGVPEIIYGSDIIDYFNPANLVYKGITQKEIEKNGNKLPEGVYRFTFEVLDYNRNVVVSNKGTVTAWMLLNDPPFINLPANNAKLKPFDPQNIVFQWTPRHRGSPNSAFTTEYEVKLVEIWPKGRNPYDAINTTRPIFETTTDATMVVYGPAETPLVLGREYALQVKAKDTGGKDLFKNNGYSEVVKFTYGDECPLPTSLLAEDIGTVKARIKWQGNGLNTGYTLRYRQKQQGTEWFEEHTNQSYFNAIGMQPGTVYEYEVGGECETFKSAYVGGQVFTTLIEDPSAFVCGDPNALPKLDGSPPLPALMINDFIHAGGFDVVVSSATGSNGQFSGTGQAIVPWFNSAKVRVTFENINVNKSYQLTGGTIKSVWDKDSKLLRTFEKTTSEEKVSTGFTSEVAGFVADSMVNVTGAIISVGTNSDGDIVVLNNEGETIVLEKGKSYAIADEVGNGYIIKEDGTILKTTATDAAYAGARGQRDYSDDPNQSVRFDKSMNTLFGLDAKREGTLAQNYIQTTNDKYVAWKALANGEQDEIAVIAEGSTDLNRVKYRRGSDTFTATAVADGQATLRLQGKTNATNEELLAIYTASDTSTHEVIAGQLNLISYDKLPAKNLVLVLVNETDGGKVDGAAIQSQLNAIYKQALASWNVNTIIQKIEVAGINENLLDDGESGMLSNYSGEMKQVLNAYLKDHTLATDTYYLFLLNNAKSGQIAGYMPRSKQAGFIFLKGLLNPEEVHKTMAHELGHGAFHLKHTFSEFPSLNKGTTDNLMDYKGGIALNKYQWDHIHNPERVLGLFEDDEDGTAYFTTTIPHIWRNSDESINFLTPAKKIIRLPKETIRAYFTFGIGEYAGFPLMPSGVLKSFTKLEGKDTVLYTATYSGSTFLGYKNKDNKYADVLGENKTIESGTALVQLPYSEGFKLFRLIGLNYSYQSSGIQNDPVINLRDAQSAKLNAVTWQEITTFSFASGQLESGISSTEINSSFADLMRKMDNANFNEQYLLVSKAMEFRTVYPDLFDKMTVSFNNWSTVNVWSETLFNDLLNLTPEAAALKLLGVENKTQITAGYFDYLCRKNEWYNKPKEELLVLFLMEFDKFITYNRQSNASTISAISATFLASCDHADGYIISQNLTADKIVNAINAMSVDELKKICSKVRVRLISTILDSFIVGDEYEKAIYKLLWTCEEGLERAAFLETLANFQNSEGKFILGTLVSAVDDQTVFMGENYNTMIMNFILKAYGDLIKSNLEFATTHIHPITSINPTKIEQLTNEQLVNLAYSIVTYNYQSFTKRLFKEVLKTICLACTFADFMQDEKSKTSFDEDTNGITYLNQTVSGFIVMETSAPKVYHPLQPIILDDKAKLLDMYQSTGGYYIPAILLYFIEKKGDAKTVVETIQTAFDVASLAIPGGQSSLALKVLNYADKVSAVSSLIGSAASNEYPAFSSFMNVTSGVLGVTNLVGTFGLSKLQSIDDMRKGVALINKSESVISAASHERELTSLCNKISLLDDAGDADLIAVLNSGNEKALLMKVMDMEKSAASAAGKSDFVKKLEVAIEKVRIYGNGVKIAKSSRLQTVIQILSNKFDHLKVQSNRIFANSSKTIQLAHLEDGELIIDKIDDISALGDNAKLQESVSDVYYLERTGDQVTGHTDDILFFEDNGTIKCLTGTNCFASNTLVKTKSGLVKIDHIKEQDEVFSYNETQKISSWKRVTHLFKKTVNKLNRLIVERDTFLVTPEHKFFTKSGWLQAAAISAGMLLQTTSGFAELHKNEVIDTSAVVYNFTVQDNHTYYVGRGQVLTHNDCEKLAALIKQLGDQGVDFVNDFKNNKALLDKFVSGELNVNVWKAVNHLPQHIRLEPSVLSKLTDIADRGRGIDLAKLSTVLGSDLGDVLSKATGNDLIKILNQLDQKHVTAAHLDDIMSRLSNPAYNIKAELMQYPDRYVTFDEVLKEPGKYWDLLQDASLPSSSYIKNWGQGKWWKDLREKANFFEGDELVPGSGIARDEFIHVNGLAEEKVVNQITIKVDGIDEPIRIDYMGLADDGKFHLGDAKFSTKDKNWASEWQSAATDNQNVVFPKMKGKNIYIRASDPIKLSAILESFGIPATAFKDGGYLIPAAKVGSLKIFGSAANNPNAVKDIVSIF